jgi:DNA-binding transcriptional regulator GbsR (MarR family)
VDEERLFADEVGMVLSGMGMPAAFGKLMGWLLICDPPQQSSAELAKALDLSAGSVSTGMRMLENAKLVRRVAMRGSRAKVYEMTENAFIIAARNEQFGTMRKLMDHGIAVLGDEASPRGRRLRRTRDFYAFLEREVPALIDRFMAEHGEGGNG